MDTDYMGRFRRSSASSGRRVVDSIADLVVRAVEVPNSELFRGWLYDLFMRRVFGPRALPDEGCALKCTVAAAAGSTTPEHDRRST